jgi:Ni,Fe-hydrogenase I cytochrome b subunit
MKIEVNEHGTIVLKEVYNPIKLVTNDGETLIIMMRDSGFEMFYENEPIDLKNGQVFLSEKLMN